MARNDWYEAGEAIRDLVQNAVENQDFTQLSSTISNIVNQTVDGFQDALRESLGGRPREDQAERTQDNWRYRAGGARFSGQEAAERIRRNMEAKKKEIRPVRTGRMAPGLVTGWTLALTGYGFGGMFGLALTILAIVGDAVGGIPDYVYAIMGLLTGLNLWMGTLGSRRLGLAGRFRRYTAMLKDRTYCMLEELASGTGKTVKYVRKDLKEMLRRGFFPEGHLDRKEMCLITDNETYQQYLLTQQEADRRAVFGQAESRSAQKERSGRAGESADGRSDKEDGAQTSGQKDGTDAGKKARASLDRECRELIEEGERYIAHIRECNDRIPGEKMSAKLDRLELVVTRIFREVERRPELAPELRRMMSYYLPTTQKLIDAYCQFDEQPIGGQNIDGTKREIENALDTINQAFENLLDGFFENTAWDISSDISVLHTMFAQEGLTGRDFPKDGKEKNR